MEETERRTESITVRLISKEQFCKIMDAIHEQDKLMDSICKSLERIADIFSFDVDNKYRKALEDLLVYLFDDTSDWIGYWMYEAYWKPFSWWDEQSVEHTVSSHEELYDFLIDNLIAHREAEAKKKNEDTFFNLTSIFCGILKTEVREVKLLLAEDERRMAQALGELLRQEGYEVDVFYDGASALDALLSNIYDGAVLDVMMPERSGYSVTSKARRHGVRTPILLLTARAGTEDKVTGLDSGADDYLTKPFQVQELLARLRALLRRGNGYADTSLTYGDVSLEPGSAMLTCIKTGQSVRVSDKELRLLEHLIRNAGHIVTREQLALKIWGYDSDAEYNNVEVYLSFTRKKLLFVGSQTEIKAVRGLGYELRCEHVS